MALFFSGRTNEAKTARLTQSAVRSAAQPGGLPEGTPRLSCCHPRLFGRGNRVPLRKFERQFQRERRALTDTVAMRVERASHLLGGQGAAVQAETVAVGPGREAVGEDARQVLSRDADAVAIGIARRMTHFTPQRFT